MTTVDLLLILGGKIGDILVALLQKKAGQKEKENAEQLIKQYNQVRDAHTQVSTIVQRYNHSIVRAIATRSLQELFPLCTHNGYKHVENLCHRYIEGEIAQLLLDKLEILSITLSTYKVNELNLMSSNEVSYQRAEAYTLETWISSYSTGERNTNEVVNQYWLLFEDGMWKVESAEVYVKSR